MEISLTKEEYLVLLEMLYLADWLLHAHQVGENQETKKYKELEDKFLAYAPDFGFQEYVCQDPGSNKYYYTRKLEQSSVRDFIQRFENDVFWEELGERLAWRDLMKQYGKREVEKLDFLSKMKKLDDLYEKYAAELAENGLEHLRMERFSETEEE